MRIDEQNVVKKNLNMEADSYKSGWGPKTI